MGVPFIAVVAGATAAKGIVDVAMSSVYTDRNLTHMNMARPMICGGAITSTSASF
jgi:hypothetical protein